MPDTDWNKAVWDRDYNWSGLGEEWSEAWGSSEAQWYGCILPRIRSFLPAQTILEIAPGHGRWTRFLTRLSHVYSGVDISDKCIEYCRSAFPDPRCSFFVNDGFDLSMVPDDSIDFVFSFDSLVHAERAVIEAYIPQILRKCRSGGVAFIHHSNRFALNASPSPDHCRALTVDATLVAEAIRQSEGEVLRQEVISWGGVDGLDCLTMFGRRLDFSVPGEVILNNDFMREAEYIRTKIAPWTFARKK